MSVGKLLNGLTNRRTPWLEILSSHFQSFNVVSIGSYYLFYYHPPPFVYVTTVRPYPLPLHPPFLSRITPIRDRTGGETQCRIRVNSEQSKEERTWTNHSLVQSSFTYLFGHFLGYCCLTRRMDIRPCPFGGLWYGDTGWRQEVGWDGISPFEGVSSTLSITGTEKYTP